MVKVLSSSDPFPLLGNWLDGEKRLTIVSNNMYAAPMFEHKARDSDFLLVFSLNRKGRLRKTFLR